MSRPEPVRLLALADLMLWIAELLAPPRRDGEASAASRSSAADLNALLQHARLAGQGWTAARLLPIEALLGTTVLAEEKSRLFDGDVVCPADECSYVRRDKGALLADINAFQRAFGLKLAEVSSERADHIAAELSLAALLLVMEVRATSREAAEVTRHAWIEFASEHLGEWLPDFAMRLASTTRLRELGDLAELLECVWHTALVVMGASQEGASRKDVVVPGDGRRTFPRDGESSRALRGEVSCSVPRRGESDTGTPYECGMVPDPD